MDKKTIQEKGNALMKAASSNESSTVLLSILNDLKGGVNATEELLRSTRIGVTVAKLRQNKHKEVASAAGEIVGKWRKEVEKERQSGATPPRSTRSPAPSQSANGNKMKEEKKDKQPSLDPEKRSWKSEKVDIGKTGSALRDSCVGMMYDGLAFMSMEPSNSVLKIAIAIESAALKAHGPEEKESYRSKLRSLYQNLKNKSNAPLRQRVLSGHISPDKFVVMTHDELKSAERRKEDAAIEKENMRAAQAPMAEKSVSTSLECGKCKQKKVSYSQAQTRSADEPMTTFCECMVCGNRWKFS